MSNAEPVDGIYPAEKDPFVARFTMDGPADRAVPLILQVESDSEGVLSFTIHGPFHERNLIGESAFAERERRRRQSEMVSWRERMRAEELRRLGLTRRYRGIVS